MVQRHAWVVAGLAGAMCLGLATLAADGDKPPETYAGQWKNAKRGTSGPLRCVLEKSADGPWKATFDGAFQGSPFKYDAEFAATKKSGAHNLKGQTKVNGEQYEWIGALKGDTLTIQYKAALGNFGTFQMKKQVEKKPPKKKS